MDERTRASFPLRMTAEEYLAFDAAAAEGEKYEFFNGLVVPRHGFDDTGVAMAGASPTHNQIAVNLAVALVPAARRRRCRSGASDQRVRSVGRSYTYPDFVLVCGEALYSDDNPAVLENPTFLVEVLSPSTERVDRGAKLTAYTALESVAEYWTVEQDVAAVTTFVREGEAWRIGRVSGLDAAVRCEALGLIEWVLSWCLAMVRVECCLARRSEPSYGRDVKFIVAVMQPCQAYVPGVESSQSP